MSPRRSVEETGRTRAAIISRAVDVASLEGLEGMTIGRLADDLDMSKAGVFAHFGSKEELQLRALEEATDIFRREVWKPNAERRPGLERLRGICESWVDYLERGVFPGGCFLSAASTEFDGRPGLVRDAVRAAALRWRRVLEAEARTARENGELPKSADPALIAFQLGGIALAANEAIQLFADEGATAKARAAMREVLRR